MTNENIPLDISNFPKECFLKKLLHYTNIITDAPDEFVIASALAGMATTIGQNVWLAFGSQALYPNLYIIKIAQSGRLRKTTSDSIIVDMLLEVCPGSVFPNEMTPEMFLMKLVHDPACLLRFNEVGSALKRMEASHYMQGMKSLMLELYDVPRIYEREIKGKKGDGEKVHVKRPTVSILGSSTIDWFNAGIQMDDIASGFLPRFLFSIVSKRTKEKMIIPGVAEEKFRTELIEILQMLKEKWQGEKKLSKEAADCYQSWVKTNEERMDAVGDYDRLAPFLDRLEKSIIKVALIFEGMLQVSKGKKFENKEEIGLEAMKFAIQICSYFQDCVRQLVLHELKLTEYDRDKKKVIEIIKKRGGECTRREVGQYTKIYPSKLRDLLEAMEELGLIEQDTVNTKSGQSFIVRLVNEPEAKDANSSIAEELFGSEEKPSDNHVTTKPQPADNQNVEM